MGYEKYGTFLTFFKEDFLLLALPRRSLQLSTRRLAIGLFLINMNSS